MKITTWILLLCLISQPCFADSQFGFTGQRFDNPPGIYFYNSRYYDPQLGRFLQPDTIVQAPGNPQTLNRYSYVGNNPVNRIDPSGHGFFLIVIGFAKLFASMAAAHPIIMGAGVGALSSGISTVVSQGCCNNITQIAQNTAVGFVTGGATGALAGIPSLSMTQAIAMGGALGAVGSAINGSDPLTGMIGGMIGGASIRIAGSIMAQKIYGAGLFGNAISAGGISAVENSISGRRWDSQYQIFLGPLSVTLSKGVKPSFGLSSFSNLFYLASAINDPHAKFNLWQTISSGTPVFNGGKYLHGSYGRTMGNVILAGNGADSIRRSSGGNYQYIIGHERIHALLQGRIGAGGTGGAAIYGAIADLSAFATDQMESKYFNGAWLNVPNDFAWKNEIQAQGFKAWGR